MNFDEFLFESLTSSCCPFQLMLIIPYTSITPGGTQYHPVQFGCRTRNGSLLWCIETHCYQPKSLLLDFNSSLEGRATSSAGLPCLHMSTPFLARLVMALSWFVGFAHLLRLSNLYQSYANCIKILCMSMMIVDYVDVNVGPCRPSRNYYSINAFDHCTVRILVDILDIQFLLTNLKPFRLQVSANRIAGGQAGGAWLVTKCLATLCKSENQFVEI